MRRFDQYWPGIVCSLPIYLYIKRHRGRSEEEGGMLRMLRVAENEPMRFSQHVFRCTWISHPLSISISHILP